MGASVSITAGPGARLNTTRSFNHSFVQQAFIEPKGMCSRLRRQSGEQERWQPCLLGADVPVEGTDDRQAQTVWREIKQGKSSGDRGSFVHGVMEDLSTKVTREAEI